MSNPSFGLGIGLSQSQKLTPQMQQAIKILQMSSLELEQEVQIKLDSNPLLERAEEPDVSESAEELDLDAWSGNDWDKSKTSTEEIDDDFGNDSLDKITDSAFDDDATDSSWQDVYGDDVGDGVASQYKQAADEEFDHQGATSQTIQDHVRWQMNFKKLSSLDKLIAEQLIDGMDDLGFIRIDLQEVVSHFATILSFYELDVELGIEEVQAVLRMIQSCSPTGVGARNLSECLLLQLQKLPHFTPFLPQAQKILHYTEHLQSNNIKALMNDTGLTGDELKSAMALIRTLDPSPAERFAMQSGVSTQEQELPDILVFAKDDHKKTTAKALDATSWRIILNPDTLPRLQINQEYASLIKRGDDSPDNQYLKNNLQDARLFIRSIEERNQNLLKVATCIVQKQQAFLLHGDTAMQPLTLREVAEIVGLHESTVSRLTTNKSMLSPQGMHSLKYFFSSHVSGTDGEEISSTAISAFIKEMIAEEDPKKPLSDSEITKRLEQKGIDIARRTVAKYREAMNILPSTQRKQKL